MQDDQKQPQPTPNISSRRKRPAVDPAARRAFRPDEVAASTGLSIETVRRDIAMGRLKARRNGRAILVLAEDVDSYLRALPEVA